MDLFYRIRMDEYWCKEKFYGAGSLGKNVKLLGPSCSVE
jgi:hypothetical protein